MNKVVPTPFSIQFQATHLERKGDHQMKQIGFKLPEKLVDRIDEEAEMQGRSRSELMRSKLAEEYFQ